MRTLPRVKWHRLGRRTWLLLGLLVAGSLGVFAWVRSGALTELRARHVARGGEALLGENDPAGARLKFREALRLDPDLPGVRLRLAELERKLGDWELAFLEYQTMTEMHPEDPDGWLGLADLMVRTGLVSAPEAALDSAIEANPRRADAHRMRAAMRFELGRYHGALRDAELAVGAEPGEVASWDLLVRSTARSKGPAAGLEAATRAVKSVGPKPILLRAQAWLLADSGRAPEALTLLDQQIQAGDDPAWRRTLARVQARAGNLPAARTQVERILSGAPLDEEMLALRSVLDAAEGHVDAAVRGLEDASQRLPRGPLLAELRSELQAAGKDRAKIDAVVARSLATELGPPPAPAARVRAEAWMKATDPGIATREHWPGRLAQTRQALEGRLRQQDWAGAEGIVDSVHLKYPGTVFAAFVGGILELARGRAEEARNQLLASLHASPRSPVVVAALAKAWSREKGATYAGDQLMRLAEADPGFAMARYVASRAYLDGREPGQAEAVLQRGLTGDPASTPTYRHLSLFYLEVDRAPEAADVCRRGHDQFPQAVSLQTMLAELQLKLGRPEEARRLLEELVSRRPDLDLVEYRLAELLASEERQGGSSRRSSELLADLGGDRPSDPALLDQLGWLAASAGETARARELLEASVSAAPEEPSPRFHLASVYARESKMDLSRAGAGGRPRIRTAVPRATRGPEAAQGLKVAASTAAS
jgi:predicted Zn-dependent protease